MARKVRHLQHGNVTVSINGPAEVVDEINCDLHIHLRHFEIAHTMQAAGSSLRELDATTDAIGGRFTDLQRSDETVWRCAINDSPRLEITVFAA